MKLMQKCGARFNVPSRHSWRRFFRARKCVETSLDTARRSACATFWLIATCALAWAQNGGVNPPQMGLMVDGFERARPVFGVSGSVTLGDPVASAVLASACSDSWCVLKTWTALMIAGVETKAPPGPAFLAIDGQTILLYFPRLGQLARWQAGNLQPVPLNVTGTIAALRSTAGVAQFAVERNGATWIVDSNDQVLDSLPAASGPVLLPPAGAIYTDGDDVVLRRRDGSDLRFPVPGVQSFSAMSLSSSGANYVEIRSLTASYALRIDLGHERIFELPEPLP